MKNVNVKTVEWNRGLSLGIPLIDRQHQTLIQIISDLCTGCLYGKKIADTYFSTTARRTMETIYNHFVTEEHIMEANGYPSLFRHRRQHYKHLKKLYKLISQFDARETQIPDKFAFYLRKRFLSHIAVVDKKYSRYCKQTNAGIILPFQQTGSLIGQRYSVRSP